MNRLKVLSILAVLCAVVAGCNGGIGVSYWMPSMENETSSGAGSDLVNVEEDLGVKADDPVFAYELVTQSGRNRMRLNYWMMQAEGSKTISSAFDFANHTYNVGDQTETELDFASGGIYWEPAIINSEKVRFGLVLGADIIKFDMVAEDLTNPAGPGDGEVHLPDSGSMFEDIGYFPVPVAGVGIEVKINEWFGFVVNARAFDTALVGLEEDADALFYGGEAGLTIGKPDMHVVGFAGYKYWHIEYDYEDDTGDATLQGVYAGVALTF